MLPPVGDSLFPSSYFDRHRDVSKTWKMQYNKLTVHIDGKYSIVDSITVNNNIVIVTGHNLKIARVKDEWYEDVDDPEPIIKTLSNVETRPDIFTFWQRLPETIPRYNYYKE